MRVIGIFDIFSSDNADEAKDKQIAGLNAGYNRASEALGQGRNALTTNYAAGLLPFQQNYELSYGNAKAGTGALGDALGINGPEGSTRATASFQNSPGYTAAVEAGTENSLRNRSRTGDLRSGATNIDLQNVAQNAQNQQWQQYISNLMPFTQMGQQGAQGAASGIGTLYSGLGNQLNANYGSLGQLGWQKETGIGNADANAALASNAASGNFVNALMSIAGLGANAAGGAGGMASLMALSDERAKDDIEQIGETFDGQPLYRFTYKSDPSGKKHIGPMAQEVEKHTPDAVREFDGLKYVDYGKATDFAAGLAKMMEAA